METINASHFKTHFGEVLNLASDRPVRVKRRGQPSTVLIAEEDYQKLMQQASKIESTKKAQALENLRTWVNTSIELKDIAGDERAEAIMAKHGKHWK
ncbi:MAG: type II toxin-antitoxin system Phd/YefM family antitoxin [Verrucomicrobiota bacterium]